MNIDVVPTADSIISEHITGKTCVVIDVLRASTVIITALSNGARSVLPVLSVEEALTRKKAYNIVGGERHCFKVEGFDVGNSPLEYTEALVKDKEVIITTTNGTKAIKGCAGADCVYIAGVINARAIATLLAQNKTDVVFVNAGTDGKFSLDDFITAGYMIDMLAMQARVTLSDFAVAARQSYISSPDFVVLNGSAHYNYLMSLGLEADIKYCFTKNSVDCIPAYVNGLVWDVSIKQGG